jgi:integrase
MRRAVLQRFIYAKPNSTEARLGPRQIEEIRRSDIIRLLDKIAAERGPSMADLTLAFLRRILSWHASRSDDFRSPIVPGMARVRPASRRRQRILSDDEIRAVWRASEAQQGPFAKLVQFLLLTGARRTEASGLRWDELDGADWLLPAARNKVGQDLLRPLSATAQQLLERMPRIGPFVFTITGRNAISGFTAFKRAFDQACDVRDWTIHDLRRTSRSLMARAGVPSDHAEHCLGHVLGGVRGTYDRHSYHSEKARAYEALAALLERIIDPPAGNVVAIGERAAAEFPAPDSDRQLAARSS